MLHLIHSQIFQNLLATAILLASLSLAVHVVLDWWTVNFLNKETEDGPVVFKNVFCSLPGWKRKTMIYAVNLMTASKKRQWLQPVGIGLAVPFVAVIVALACVLTALWSIWLEVSLLKARILRALLPPDIRAQHSQDAWEKLQELNRSPENVRLLTMARHLPPEDDLDWSNFMRPLMKMKSSTEPTVSS